MGIVVLRSTTPCVAVNSRSNSNLLTVISMVPTATAASTGITSPQLTSCRATSSTTLISNAKPIKPAVTVGPSEKWKTQPTRLLSPGSSRTFDVRNRSQTLRSQHCNRADSQSSSLPYTASTSYSQPP